MNQEISTNRLDQIFNINSFNVYSDKDYYYFFRALNMADNHDLDNKVILDGDNHINKIRTNRERYTEDPIYHSDSFISLQEVFDHIKMRQRKDTNCISLTSNANTALTYGRGNYKDNYIIVKVPKEELESKVFTAGLYMMKEISKKIDTFILNNEVTENQKKVCELIDNIKTQEELDKIEALLPKESVEKTSENLVGGLTKNKIQSQNYLALNDEQNFEKNKLILKLNIISKNVLPNVSNSFLIRTLGNAFSSLELIHYKDIEKAKIIEEKKEIIDVLGLLQQVPNELEYIEEIKGIVLSKLDTISINSEFNYGDYHLAEDTFTIEKMYELTGGRVDYKTASTMYKKAFFLAKSKLRTANSINLLNDLLENNSKYYESLQYMLENTYGIEPEITTRITGDKVKVSESVSLDFNEQERSLFHYINDLNREELNYIITNPTDTLKLLLNNFYITNYEEQTLSMEDYYANSIIDILDWNRLGVTENLSSEQRADIINALKEHNFLQVYYDLKQQGIEETKIADVLFTNLIKEKDTIDINETFTLEELEYFIDYNRVNNTKLNLRSYQATALKNIDRIFEDKQFTSAILPTGAGKSFVALAEMFEHKNEELLYLAPNNEILNQLQNYIIKVFNPEKHLGESKQEMVKRIFPNLTLSTYAYLTSDNAQNMINKNYNLILFDELHRTGASEWEKQIGILLDYQSEETKILGITATPERDADLKDMADHWAQRYGYTDEEILKNKHLAMNIDIVEAIKLGYVVNPKVVNCEYSLLQDGSLDNLKIAIDHITDDALKQEELKIYEKLRRNIEQADGVEKIFNDHLKKDGKYIVFLPVNRKDDGTYEDEDGNFVSNQNAERMIKAYETLISQYIFMNDYLNEPGNRLVKIYNKISQNQDLNVEEEAWLNNEKSNILLLTKINIKNKSNVLDSKVSLMVDSIIDVMHWNKMDDLEQSKMLSRKTKNQLNVYSMLGSYSDKKNNTELSNFNSDKSNKMKFMFVMNKLNEGVHVEDIDGIVWLRTLDENSRILYLQQLGRCIYSIDPNKEIPEDKRPLVLDLVNNTLKVKLYKGETKEEKDLNTLSLIEAWIDKANTIPDVKVNDEVEFYYAVNLRKIKKDYNKYIENPELLTDKNVKTKVVIKEILKIGSQFDLWNLELEEIEQTVLTSKNKNKETTNYNIFEINGILSDFVDLETTVREHVYVSDEEKTDEYIKTLKKLHRHPKTSYKNGGVPEEIFNDGQDQRYYYNYLQQKYSKLYFTKELTEEEKYIKMYYEKIMEVMKGEERWIEDKKTESIIEFIHKNHRLPKKASCNRGVSEAIFEIGVESVDGIDQRNYYNVLHQQYNKLDFTKELTEEEQYIKTYYEKIKEAMKEEEQWIEDQKTESIIEFIHKNHRLPKAARLNKGVSEAVFEIGIENVDGVEQRSFYDYLQKKYNKLDFTKELTEEEQYIKMYYEKINAVVKAEERWIEDQKTESIIEFIHKNHRLPKAARLNKGVSEAVFEIGIENVDGQEQRVYYTKLQQKYSKLDFTKELTEEEQMTKDCYEKIMEAVKEEERWIENQKADSIIEFIHEHHRLPKSPNQNRGVSEAVFEIGVESVDGIDQRSFYEYLHQKYNKLDFTKELTEEEQSVKNSYEKIKEAMKEEENKNKENYMAAKETFDTDSKFNDVSSKINGKGDTNGRKIS